MWNKSDIRNDVLFILNKFDIRYDKLCLCEIKLISEMINSGFCEIFLYQQG